MHLHHWVDAIAPFAPVAPLVRFALEAKSELVGGLTVAAQADATGGGKTL